MMDYDSSAPPDSQGGFTIRRNDSGWWDVVDDSDGKTILPLYPNKEGAEKAREEIIRSTHKMRAGGVVGKLKHRIGLAEGGVAPESWWYVIESMPGYMPESDPTIFATEKEAESYARELEAELAEQNLSDKYVVEVMRGEGDEPPDDMLMAEGGVVSDLFGNEESGYDKQRLDALKSEYQHAKDTGNDYAAENLKHAIDRIKKKGMAEGGVTMTRKGFQQMAQGIYELEGLTDEQRMSLAEKTADNLAATNPRFDRERFLTWAMAGPPDTHYKAQEGIAVVENEGPGVDAVIGEAGPEAVIPLDDPQAVEVMAEAIEEGSPDASSESVEEVAEAASDVAEAAEAVAEASEEIAEVAGEIAEAAIEASVEVVEVEAAAEVVEDIVEAAPDTPEPVEEEAPQAVNVAVPDRAPRSAHWSERPLFKKKR